MYSPLKSYHPIESQKLMESYEIDQLAIDINLYGINYLPKKYISTPLISNNLNVIFKFQVQPPKELPSDWESKTHGTLRNWPWRLCRALCRNSINLWRIQRNVWISTEKLSQTTKRIWLWKGLPTCLWENKQARTQLKCFNNFLYLSTSSKSNHSLLFNKGQSSVLTTSVFYMYF